MKLKEIREGKKISQIALAAEIGVTQGTISQWENGLCSPSLDSAQKLARSLNVTVDELIGENNEQPNEDRGSDLVPQVYADADQRAA